MKTMLLSILIIVSLTVTVGSSSFAQTDPVFIQLGQAKGALYKPDSGPAPHVGIIVMHREANYMNNIACTEFSKRGFMVLCMNSRFENNESEVNWELIPLDVAQALITSGTRNTWQDHTLRQQRRRYHEFLSGRCRKRPVSVSGIKEAR